MNDADIIGDVLAGNTSQFTELVDRYLLMVRGLCSSYIYDPSEQDDLVQESFTYSYMKLNSLRNRKKFGPWLARITRGKCMNWVRSRTRRDKAHRSFAAESRDTTEGHALDI